MSDASKRLSLFPLHTVLFPGGVLPLRVFEARYVDMIRATMRAGTEFGVCLIRSGREVGGEPAEIEPIGCRARIVDWSMEQLGVLQITTVGTSRFRVIDREVRPDGLVVADVTALPDDPAMPPPIGAAPCVALLERVLEHWRQQPETDPPESSPIAPPYRLDDASWVGNRLAELMPLPLPIKQTLMTTEDPAARLVALAGYLVDGVASDDDA